MTRNPFKETHQMDKTRGRLGRVAVAVAVVVAAAGTVLVAAGPAQAQACQSAHTYDSSPYYGMNWSATFRFHYSDRFRTTVTPNACSRDAVRFTLTGWSIGFQCGRTRIRTLNEDFTTRTLYGWDSHCPGTTARFVNVDRGRLFRVEWDWDEAGGSDDQQGIRPIGGWSY
jgi:hypothetical protein